jgi:organic radical activating enzyme
MKSISNKQYICSELFYSMDLRFIKNVIKNCCKADNHYMSAEEFKNNPSILSRNKELDDRKRSMILDNKLPYPSCKTCINFMPNSFFDKRSIWHNTTLLDEFKENLLNKDYVNRFTISLSSSCDLKCVYCAPKDSSSWAKEVGYTISKPSKEWFDAAYENFLNYLSNKKYYKDVDYWFFISGGEPTYNPKNFDLISEIIKRVPNQNLRIGLNTNLNTKEKVFNEYVKLFKDYKDVKWQIDFSCDSVTKRAEAIRYGLNWDRAFKNLQYVLNNNFDNVNIRLANTVSVFSLPYFKEDIQFYYEYFGEKTAKFLHPENSFNYAVEPGMSIMGMPEYFKKDIDQAIEYCNNNNLNYLIPFLNNIKNLIGTKIIDNTPIDFDITFNYFNIKRPDKNWNLLFPHMQPMIDYLYNQFPNTQKYVPDLQNLKRPVSSYYTN